MELLLNPGPVGRQPVLRSFSLNRLHFWITYNPYPFFSLLKDSNSASACAPVCRVHATYQLPLVASLKLDKLSEVCFSGLNYSDFFPAAAPRNQERMYDSQDCLESQIEEPQLQLMVPRSTLELWVSPIVRCRLCLGRVC